MRSRTYLGLLAVVLAIGVAGAVLFLRSDLPPGNVALPKTAKEGRATRETAPGGRTSPRSPTSPAPVSPMSLMGAISSLLSRLQRGEGTDGDLAALKAILLAAPPAEAIAAIRDFLALGTDAATRQDFQIGDGGALAGAPTLRVFLLDLLGQIARGSDGAAVGGVARAVLQEKRSADEWAVALRNVAWAEPSSREFLAGKIREMLAHEPWTRDPSPGFLEAFDVMVYSRDPAFLPALSDLLRGGSEPLQRASAVALDRLSEAAPLEVMAYLNQNPAAFSDTPFLRADYFAKADLTQPAQREQLETYLTRPDVSLPEKEKLLKALATPASFVSNNLLTTPPPPDPGTARQSAVQQTLTQWQETNRFPELGAQMGQVQERIGR